MPHSSGVGKYVAVGAVLLLLTVVLLVWKLRGASEATANPNPLATVSVPPTPTESKIDDIPPPPVIDDTPAPEAGVAKTVVKVVDPCAVKSCGGASTPELESAIAVRAKQARRCYEAELKNDPSLRGKMQMSVRIAATGLVCTTSVQSSEIPQISSCVERQFRGASLPSPKGGCVDVNVPLSFVPGR